MAAARRHDYTAEEITTGLLAVIAWAGNHAAAERDLAERGVHVDAHTLMGWTRTTHFAEFQRLRDEHAPQIEAQLAHQFRDVAAKAVAVQMKALERAEERLDKNLDDEPARTASFAARAGQTAVDKLMTLTNRPQQITEKRDINEVLRSLAAQKIIVALPNGSDDQAQPPQGA
jgi:hypothetical protein